MLWQDSGSSATRVRLSYYVKRGAIHRLRKGIYAKTMDYSKYELATRIFTPSYVSFETVLAKEGLIFQVYDSVYVASYTTREITIDKHVYSYKTIKNTVLMNSIGIENKNETSIATKERAFLDTLYINNDYHSDTLRSLDWDKVFQILPIYDNQRMTKKVKQLFKSK